MRSGTTPPLALVTLPDGQQIRASVLARKLVGGVWWYRLEIQLVTMDKDSGKPAPRAVAFTAPHPIVQPLPGVDYSGVPGGLPRPAAPPPVAERPWTLMQVSTYKGASLDLHHDSCFIVSDRQRQSSSGKTLTDADAVELVSGGGVEPCLCHYRLTVH